MVASKFRYLVMELVLWDATRQCSRPFRTSLTQMQLLQAIRQSVQLNFGQHGAASCYTHLQVKYFNPVTNLCLIRCTRSEYQRVWCSMAFLTSVEDVQLTFNLLLLSGNLRACKRKTLQLEKDKLKLLQETPGNNLLTEEIEEFQAQICKINSVVA